MCNSNEFAFPKGKKKKKEKERIIACRTVNVRCMIKNRNRFEFQVASLACCEKEVILYY